MEFSWHAKLQMGRRHITPAEVQEAVDNPGTTYLTPARPPHTGNNLNILGRTSAGRRLKVVVREEDNSYVITVADRDVED